MRLLLVLTSAVILTGCGTMGEYSCAGKIRCSDKSEPSIHEKAKQRMQEREAEHEASMARYRAESEARRAKIEAEFQARKAEEKRLDELCANFSKESRTMTASEQTAIETAVKDVLKDPWSAHFRKTTKVSAWRECRYGDVYAGEVNSKNSYGGYEGFRSFTVGKKGVVSL